LILAGNVQATFIYFEDQKLDVVVENQD